MRYCIRTLFCLAIFFACNRQTDRDHLAFTSSIAEIEHSIIQLDSILKEYPMPTDESIQSYHYKIDYKGTLLFVNSKNIGDVNKISLSTISKSLNLTEENALVFRQNSLALLKNNVSHRIHSHLGWIYIYKYSNDRDQARPLKYSTNLKSTIDSMGSNGYKLVDQKRNLLLFKHG